MKEKIDITGKSPEDVFMESHKPIITNTMNKDKTEQIRETKKLELELLSLEAKILKCLNHEDGQIFLEYIELVKTKLLQKLEEQKQITRNEMIEEIEKLKRTTLYANVDYTYGYNQALDTVLSIIKSK